MQDIWEIGDIEAQEISDKVKVTSDNCKPPTPPVFPWDKLPPSANTLMAQDSGMTPINKGVDWEDKLERKALTRWPSLVTDLQGLNDIRVPCCYFKCTDVQP